MNTTKITDPQKYLKISLSSQVKLIILVEFLVAFHTYGFITEFILVTTATLLACCSAFVKNKPEYQQVRKVCDNILVIMGTLIFISSILNISMMSQVGLSVLIYSGISWCQYCYLYLYCYMCMCFIFFSAYERALIMTRIFTDSRQLQWYAKFRSFVAFKGKPKHIHEWLHYSCISEFESRKTIRLSIRKFKEQQRSSTV